MHVQSLMKQYDTKGKQQRQSRDLVRISRDPNLGSKNTTNRESEILEGFNDNTNSNRFSTMLVRRGLQSQDKGEDGRRDSDFIHEDDIYTRNAGQGQNAIIKQSQLSTDHGHMNDSHLDRRHHDDSMSDGVMLRQSKRDNSKNELSRQSLNVGQIVTLGNSHNKISVVTPQPFARSNSSDQVSPSMTQRSQHVLQASADFHRSQFQENSRSNSSKIEK